MWCVSLLPWTVRKCCSCCTHLEAQGSPRAWSTPRLGTCYTPHSLTGWALSAIPLLQFWGLGEEKRERAYLNSKGVIAKQFLETCTKASFDWSLALCVLLERSWCGNFVVTLTRKLLSNNLSHSTLPTKMSLGKEICLSLVNPLKRLNNLNVGNFGYLFRIIYINLLFKMVI